MMGRMFDFGFNNNWFGGFGASWVIMIAMSVIRLLIIVGIIVLIVKLVKKNSHPTNSTFSSSNRSLEILKERYAKGEINEEEYQRRKRILEEK